MFRELFQWSPQGGSVLKRRTLQDRGRGVIQQNEMSVEEKERERTKCSYLDSHKNTVFAWLHNHVLFVPSWWTESHEITKLHLGSASSGACNLVRQDILPFMLGSGFFTAVMGETLATLVGPVRPVGLGEPDVVRAGDSYIQMHTNKQKTGVRKLQSNSADLDYYTKLLLKRNLKCNLNKAKGFSGFCKMIKRKCQNIITQNPQSSITVSHLSVWGERAVRSHTYCSSCGCGWLLG